tara:strand:- start:1782 stop:1973 length:192 start_codon:yes stop_codon:yes gene_type:complete
LLTTDLVDIGFHGAIVALCDVEHLGEEALDFLIKGNAIRIGVIGDGQFVSKRRRKAALLPAPE